MSVSIWAKHPEYPSKKVEARLSAEDAARKLAAWKERHRTTGWTYEVRIEDAAVKFVDQVGLITESDE
jgi:hypothetical protein